MVQLPVVQLPVVLLPVVLQLAHSYFRSAVMASADVRLGCLVERASTSAVRTCAHHVEMAYALAFGFVALVRADNALHGEFLAHSGAAHVNDCADRSGVFPRTLEDCTRLLCSKEVTNILAVQFDEERIGNPSLWLIAQLGMWLTAFWCVWVVWLTWVVHCVWVCGCVCGCVCGWVCGWVCG
jgi:hypothetical protein